MSMGIGYALSEEMKFDDRGRLLNGNLLDYKLPTAMDHPELRALFVETDDPSGPFGNKALGEPPSIPVAPAIRKRHPSGHRRGPEPPAHESPAAGGGLYRRRAHRRKGGVIVYDITSIYQAQSADDAIAALRADPSAVVIAGGTDVLIKCREGKLAGCRLVSIHELQEELAGVHLDDSGDVRIGSLTTFRGVTYSDVIRKTVPVLGEAADTAGGPQLRAAGTIGGNVCNGVTSADTASTLMALDAQMHVKGPDGWRIIPIGAWYQGVGKVALATRRC